LPPSLSALFFIATLHLPYYWQFNLLTCLITIRNLVLIFWNRAYRFFQQSLQPASMTIKVALVLLVILFSLFYHDFIFSIELTK